MATTTLAELLKYRQGLARTEYEKFKDVYTSYGETPEDVSDDIHGALFHMESGAWHKSKSCQADIQLFLAGELLAKRSYAAANSMLMGLPAWYYDEE